MSLVATAQSITLSYGREEMRGQQHGFQHDPQYSAFQDTRDLFAQDYAVPPEIWQGFTDDLTDFGPHSDLAFAAQPSHQPAAESANLFDISLQNSGFDDSYWKTNTADLPEIPENWNGLTSSAQPVSLQTRDPGQPAHQRQTPGSTAPLPYASANQQHRDHQTHAKQDDAHTEDALGERTLGFDGSTVSVTSASFSSTVFDHPSAPGIEGSLPQPQGPQIPATQDQGKPPSSPSLKGDVVDLLETRRNHCVSAPYPPPSALPGWASSSFYGISSNAGDEDSQPSRNPQAVTFGGYSSLATEMRGAKRKYKEDGIGWQCQEIAGQAPQFNRARIEWECQVCGLKYLGELDFGKKKKLKDASRRYVDVMSWHLDSREYSTGREPCIRGITLFPENTHKDCNPANKCCPPPGAETLGRKVIICPFDNCPFVETSHANMKAHLFDRNKKIAKTRLNTSSSSHHAYFYTLLRVCRNGGVLEEADRHIISFVMKILHEREDNGHMFPQRSSVALEPDEIESPANPAQHRFWTEELDPTPKIWHEVVFHEPGSWRDWRRRLYHLNADPDKPHHVRDCDFEQVWFNQNDAGSIIPPELLARSEFAKSQYAQQADLAKKKKVERETCCDVPFHTY